jgi:hypothetical protein
MQGKRISQAFPATRRTHHGIAAAGNRALRRRFTIIVRKQFKSSLHHHNVRSFRSGQPLPREHRNATCRHAQDATCLAAIFAAERSRPGSCRHFGIWQQRAAGAKRKLISRFGTA